MSCTILCNVPFLVPNSFFKAAIKGVTDLFLDTAESNAGSLPPTTVFIAVLKAVICSPVKSRLFKYGVSN